MATRDIKVEKINIYMNPNLTRKFDLKLLEFQNKYTAKSSHSQHLILFHGTKSSDFVANIMDNNFIYSQQGYFGPGVYFSEFPSYTFGYGEKNI